MWINMDLLIYYYVWLRDVTWISMDLLVWMIVRCFVHLVSLLFLILPSLSLCIKIIQWSNGQFCWGFGTRCWKFIQITGHIQIPQVSLSIVQIPSSKLHFFDSMFVSRCTHQKPNHCHLQQKTVSTVSTGSEMTRNDSLLSGYILDFISAPGHIKGIVRW